MNRREKEALETFLEDFKQNEKDRKEMRIRLVKAMEKVERELYDDPSSSNVGALTRINTLEQAVKEIGDMVKRSKVRNEIIIGIMGAIGLAVATTVINRTFDINLLS
jgi:hypothetical protein